MKYVKQYTKSDEILLSISILMSGRKETRQCLDSLVPILEKVPSELILVDTGCDEEKRCILEEYTDIIIDFEWCNDFSKARNVGLEKAKGKWFMFLDDDEWFVDTSEIIDFFNRGEHNNYNSAMYKVRNFSNMDESAYTDDYVARMTRIFSNVKFKGSIHESMVPRCAPVKYFNFYLKHFGYVYKTRKDMFSDAMRNLNLLKEEIKKNPYDFRMAALTLQEYKRMNEFDNMLEFSKSYVEKCGEDRFKNTEIAQHLGSFYAFILEAYMRKYEYKECLEYVDKVLADERINEVTKAFTYRTELFVCYELKEYDRSRKAFLNYMNVYEDIGHNVEILNRQQFVLTSDTFQKGTMRQMILIGIQSSLEIGENDVLYKYFDMVQWEEEYAIPPTFIDTFMKYVLKQDNSDEYINYINEMLKKKSVIGQITKYVQSIEEKINKKNKVSTDTIDYVVEDVYVKKDDVEDEIDNDLYFERAIKLLSQVKEGYWYFRYLKVLNYKYNQDKELCLGNFEKLFDCVVDIFNLDNKIWEIAAELEVDFDMIVKSMDFAKWQVGISRWIEHVSIEDIEFKLKVINKWNNVSDFRYKYLNMKIKEGYLKCLDKEKIEFEDLEHSLFDYANTTYEYCRGIYNEVVFEEHTEVLPKECNVAIKLLEVEKLRKKKKNSEVIGILKDTINIQESFNEIIKLYVQKMGEYIEMDDKGAKRKEDDKQEELKQLVVVLKLKAREFIENGAVEEAKIVLGQIIQCVPEDEEAREILSMLD